MLFSQQTEVLRVFFFFLISGFLRPCAFFLPVFFTGLLRQLTACSVVKICFVVFLFPHCCLPLFHLEELFPFSAWKQAAGQQHVSLFLVVRSFGQLSFIFQTNQDVFLFVFHFCSFGLFLPTIFHTLSFLRNIFDSSPPFFQLFLLE